MARFRTSLTAAALALLVSAVPADARRHHGHPQGQSAQAAVDGGGSFDPSTQVAIDGGSPWDAADDVEQPPASGGEPPAAGQDDDTGDDVDNGGMSSTPPAKTTQVLPGVDLPGLGSVTLPTIKGTVARLKADGRAAVPIGAPATVRAVIRAANAIIGKPYKWGGGHGKLTDSGYDCSGAVSYALIRAGQLNGPLVSGDLAKTYAAGKGRWLSIYANAGHVYMEVAGLRLDTSSVGDPRGRSGVRWRPVIGKRPGFHSRHPVGL